MEAITDYELPHRNKMVVGKLGKDENGTQIYHYSYVINESLLFEFHPLMAKAAQINHPERFIFLREDETLTEDCANNPIDPVSLEIWNEIRDLYKDPCSYAVQLLENSCFQLDENLDSENFQGKYLYHGEEWHFHVKKIRGKYIFAIELRN